MANQKKIEDVKELTAKIKEVTAIVLIDYQGLKGSEETKLRRTMREANVEYLVAKNRIFKLALKEAGIEANFDKELEGTTSFVLSKDPVAGAKLAYEYSKGKDIFKIKAGLLDGKKVDAKGVEVLATLPSKEVLVAKLLGSLNSPITGFVGVLSGTIRSLAIALEEVRKQKEANA
jgi:large subunit ribosomal protein L10